MVFMDSPQAGSITLNSLDRPLSKSNNPASSFCPLRSAIVTRLHIKTLAPLALLFLVAALSRTAGAQRTQARSQSRITKTVDDRSMVRLSNTTHLAIRTARETG